MTRMTHTDDVTVLVQYRLCNYKKKKKKKKIQQMKVLSTQRQRHATTLQ